MNLLITGINGFIGYHLLEAVLRDTDWQVQGFDLKEDNVMQFKHHPRFSMKLGDVFDEGTWMEAQVKACDVVIPLAGIAKPAYYITHPLWTFELDFEQNLKLVRLCAAHGKRVIFPSTSEVYGLSMEGADREMKEDESLLVTGPIEKTRWIYSCSKQMMDRVIFAFGQEKGMPFTLFRPFNWIGPRLDTFKDAEERKARSITQFIYDVLHRGSISLVGGGDRRRSFTWIGDGVQGLLKIIANEEGKANQQIFNIGNPHNGCSIRELAQVVVEEMKTYPCFKEKAAAVKFESVSAEAYYGKSYDDMQDRVPSIRKMEEILDWHPKTTLRQAVRNTLDWYAEELR